MNKYLNPFIKKYNLPRWFFILNYISLAPIVLWPIVFFGSIFMLDDPKASVLLFFTINCYPFLLIGLTLLSFNVYTYNKLLAIFICLIPIIAELYLLYLLILQF